MKIIISPACKSLTGSLGRGFGYSIQQQRNGFYSKRNSKGIIPPDGHWRFILACAELAKNSLHITDIKVSRKELYDALWEAHHFLAAQNLRLDFYHASDILNLKKTFGL